MKQNKKIVILGTGGTIVSSGTSSTQMTGYEITELNVTSLIEALPELTDVAQIEAEQIANIDSSSMNEAIWLKLSRRINELVQMNDVDGIVVTHGTDTLEETAYFLNLTVKSRKPVVLVGAMRPATALSADGPLNLLNATRVAAAPSAIGKGVLVVLNDKISSAREAMKTNTSNVQTFNSPEFGVLGFVNGTEVSFLTMSTKKHTFESEFDLDGVLALPYVEIHYAHAHDSDLLVRAAINAKVDGIVHAGTGNGSIHQTLEPALLEARQKGIAVIRASRVVGGATLEGLARWQEASMIPAGTLSPQKARILLQLALLKTNDYTEIKRIFETY